MKVAPCVSSVPQQAADKKLKHRLSPGAPPQAHLPGREDQSGVQPPAEGSRLREVTWARQSRPKTQLEASLLFILPADCSRQLTIETLLAGFVPATPPCICLLGSTSVEFPRSIFSTVSSLILCSSFIPMLRVRSLVPEGQVSSVSPSHPSVTVC